MSGLPWFRIDTDIASHDKIMALTNDPGAPAARRYQAAWSYVCGIAWSVGHGTDGEVPPFVLPLVHGTRATANLLVAHRLWEPNDSSGWRIHNFADYQEVAVISEARRREGRRAACRRWHGADCWSDLTGCSRKPDPPP